MASKNELQDVQPSRKFSQMDFAGKMKFLGKVVIFFVSLGFVFPTIFSPD